MKKTIIISAMLFFTVLHVSAQGSLNPGNVAMRDDFSSISKFGSRQTSSQVIQTYSSNEIKGSQFFYPNWTPGNVVTVNNETIANNYLFLFDRVRQELFIKLKDSDVVLTAEKTQIASFTLTTDKAHLFVPDTKFNKEATSKGIRFYEVIEMNDNGYCFFKFVDTKFVKSNPNDMMKIKSGDFSDEFVDNITYYVFSPEVGLTKISFKEQSILKALETSKQEKAKAYFSAHNSERVDENFVSNLVRMLNAKG